MDVPRLIVAGERSGVGKSTITVGLLMALKERGMVPQPFKVGPDFLDPMHHSFLMDRASRNLDTWMFPDSVEEILLRSSIGSDISIIEGVMGLYDGHDGISEEGSTAHLAKMTGTPVILIVDAYGSARSAGAVALGFQAYDPGVDIAGVIFNNVAGRGHLRMLEDSLKGIESLGGLPKDDSMSLESRHLGLIPASEDPDTERYLRIGRFIADHLDVDRIIEMARSASPVDRVPIEREPFSGDRTRIGVAMDKAFNFYYEHNLDLLRWNGADLVPFSPMIDPLPDVDGLYFGGGYPELFIEELENNHRSREMIRKLSNEGMPIYAECGGMMYLCREIMDLDGNRRRMAGVFDATVEMSPRLEALGYVDVEVIRDTPLSAVGGRTRGHVFHYSRVVESAEEEYSYRLSGSKGIDGERDGFIASNTLSSYTHLHFAACPEFAAHFVEESRKYSRR